MQPRATDSTRARPVAGRITGVSLLDVHRYGRPVAAAIRGFLG
jgi:hypothetical protein